MATGLDSVTVCHPVEVSLVKVADANNWPLAVHTCPTWVPVFPDPL